MKEIKLVTSLKHENMVNYLNVFQDLNKKSGIYQNFIQ
jgi:hypothetical protein